MEVAHTADPVVKTKYGKLQGTTENGLHSFKGIHYGASTAHENRFLPSQPVKPWAGVKEAKEYGPSCWQPPENVMRMGFWGATGVDAMSEDCLVLNVWTRGLKDNGKCPVMVWIHGGGYRTESGNHTPFYSGANLARTYDVVTVSVNHRLGICGYLHLGEVLGEKYATSGNNGMLDLVQALQWVKDNIAGFGGDPNNVMIYGESGGGAKVSTLLGMPAAKGLFHRAAIQSGPSLRNRNAEDATLAAREFLDVVHVTPDRTNWLHEMKAYVIYSAWMSLNQGMERVGGDMSPVMDGKVIPAHPFDPVAAPTAKDVPVIVGTNKDEHLFMMMRDPLFGRFDDAQMRQRVVGLLSMRVGEKVAAERADALIAGYRRTRPGATPHDILGAIGSDRMRLAAIRLAERKAAAGGAPACSYLFTWESEVSRGRLKSAHSFEIPYVMNYMDDPSILFLGNKPERLKLAAAMSGAWTTFVRTGDPNHQGLSKWPAYDAAKRATMLFNIESQPQNDPFAEERNLWDGII